MLPRSAVNLLAATVANPRSSGARRLHTSREVSRGFPLRRALGVTKKRSQATRNAEIQAWKNELVEANQKAKEAGLKNDWILKTAVIVERPELLAPEPPEWYQKYVEFKTKWDEPINKQKPDIMDYFKASEEAEAKSSSTGDKNKNAKKPAAAAGGDKKPEGAEASDLDAEAEARKKRADQLRAEAEEAEEEQYGPRITEADKKNDRKSLRRKLDRKLFLVIKKNNKWQLPDAAHDGKDTTSMRAVAETAMATALKDTLKHWFVGNHPIGVTTFAFDAEAQKKHNAYGDKVFYYYSYYIQGKVAHQDPAVTDHVWVTKDELPEYLDEPTVAYLNRVLPMEGLF